MTEPPRRDEVIELLKKLGSERDEDVLEVAREVHARIAAADIDWEDLLVPEDAADDDDDFEDEAGEIDDEVDDEADEIDDEADEIDDDESPEPEDESPEPDDTAARPVTGPRLPIVLPPPVSPQRRRKIRTRSGPSGAVRRQSAIQQQSVI